jgi:starvation-inducible DNA-binding protein
MPTSQLFLHVEDAHGVLQQRSFKATTSSKTTERALAVTSALGGETHFSTRRRAPWMYCIPRNQFDTFSPRQRDRRFRTREPTQKIPVAFGRLGVENLKGYSDSRASQRGALVAFGCMFDHSFDRQRSKKQSSGYVSRSKRFNKMRSSIVPYTLPGMSQEEGEKVAGLLQQRLSALIDMQLTLKHIHWNVVGPTFIGVHEMLDPQYAAVSVMVDDLAERIAALGSEAMGTPGFVAKNRTWDDYSLNRAGVMEHLGGLDLVYSGVIKDHRRVMKELEELDPVSQDLIIGQLGELEKFHWFVRAHLENDAGDLATQGNKHIAGAAAAAHKATNETT